METGLQAGLFRIQIPVGVTDFSVLHKHQDIPGAKPDSNLVGTGILSEGVEVSQV
jgi:hypothetical protein